MLSERVAFLLWSHTAFNVLYSEYAWLHLSTIYRPSSKRLWTATQRLNILVTRTLNYDGNYLTLFLPPT